MTAILSFSMGRLYAENVSKTWKLSVVKGLKGQLYFAILCSLEIWKYSEWKDENVVGEILPTWPTRMISSITQAFPYFPKSVWSFLVMTLSKVAWHSACNLELLYMYSAGVDPGEVKWVNFHPLFLSLLLSFFFRIPQILK